MFSFIFRQHKSTATIVMVVLSILLFPFDLFHAISSTYSENIGAVFVMFLLPQENIYIPSIATMRSWAEVLLTEHIINLGNELHRLHSMYHKGVWLYHFKFSYMWYSNRWIFMIGPSLHTLFIIIYHDIIFFQFLPSPNIYPWCS